MERVAEPELMLDTRQALAYARANFEQPHQHFVTLLSSRLPNLPSRARAVDLGCGPCDITLRVARAFPGWTLDAIDASPTMLDLGRRSVGEAGLEARVRLHELYLPSATAPRAAYDVLLSNSLLHHLKDPSVLWSTLQAWSRPGAAAFVMDLARPKSEEVVDALVNEYTRGEHPLLKRDFKNSLSAAYTTAEVRRQLQSLGLSDFSVETVSDRHFIAWGTLGSS